MTDPTLAAAFDRRDQSATSKVPSFQWQNIPVYLGFNLLLKCPRR